MTDKLQIHPNLSNADGSLISVLQDNSNELKRMCDDEEVDVDSLKSYLFEMFAACIQNIEIKDIIAKVEQIIDKKELAILIFKLIKVLV